MNGRRDWNISKTELFKLASNLQKPYNFKGVNYIEKFNLREVMIKVHYRLLIIYVIIICLVMAKT